MTAHTSHDANKWNKWRCDKEVKVTWELRSPGQPNLVQGAWWKHWEVFNVCRLTSICPLLSTSVYSTRQTRLKMWRRLRSSMENWWDLWCPRRATAVPWRRTEWFHQIFRLLPLISHYQMCLFILTDLFVLPDFSCFLFAVDSRWTTCTAAFCSWWCGHVTRCFVKCQGKWQSWVCRNAAAAADGRIRCAFSSVGILTRDPYSFCCYNVFRTVLLLIAVFT